MGCASSEEAKPYNWNGMRDPNSPSRGTAINQGSISNSRRNSPTTDQIKLHNDHEIAKAQKKMDDDVDRVRKDYQQKEPPTYSAAAPEPAQKYHMPGKY